MKISIAMATYNGAKFLSAQLKKEERSGQIRTNFQGQGGVTAVTAGGRIGGHDVTRTEHFNDDAGAVVGGCPVQVCSRADLDRVGPVRGDTLYRRYGRGEPGGLVP